ncbi:cytochrome c biogenesis CcdA family protein [Micromonospora sp. DT81.3]|uniref:cytochrome c biogenesis CcdA family protein n=1 Tax=Micromonospora sp. DT81.3 TaxID=3416523 RepID=UPI003CF1BFC4
MEPGAIVYDGALLAAIPIALLAGLLSFLSPCVLPLVPGYLGFVSGMATTSTAPGGSQQHTGTMVATRSRLITGVLLFIGGFTVVFLVAFVITGAAGIYLMQYRDILIRISGVFVIVMGLVFIGVFGRLQRTLRPTIRNNMGLAGAPLLGAAMGIGWAPCIGPTLATILVIAANTGDIPRAATLGLAYSLGLGIPFLLIALGLGWASNTMGFLRRHIRVINLIGGTLLILLGVLMITGVWTAVMSFLGSLAGSIQLPL